MRHCKCCVHRSHRKIDQLLLQGVSFAEVGRRYGIHHEAVARHFRHHLQKSLQRHAQTNREQLRYGSRLQEQLDFIASSAESILAQAQAANNLGVALQALRELREAARLAAIAAGELDDGSSKTQVNVMINNSGDTLRNVRAYLAACHVPPELTEPVMGYIEAAESATS